MSRLGATKRLTYHDGGRGLLSPTVASRDRFPGKELEMHLRTSLVLAGATLAIAGPTAGAALASRGPITENSNGASLPQTRHVGSSRSNAKVVRVVSGRIVVTSGGPVVGAPDDDCTYMLNAPDCS
jgi:hypothetical protein